MYTALFISGSQHSLGNVTCSVEVLLSPSSDLVSSVIIFGGGDIDLVTPTYLTARDKLYALPCFRFYQDNNINT